MNDNIFDLQFVRALFSKLRRTSFGLLDKAENKIPFVSLFFGPEESTSI